MVCLGEGAGQSTHCRGATSKMKGGDTFLVKWGRGGGGWTGGMIQGDNSAGHCFVLRDLIPMKSFK